VHNGTDVRGENWNTRGTRAALHRQREKMLLIIGLVLTALAALLVYRARVPGGVNDAQLGWVSERWLAEHRASTNR
jgi:hypothetical protein